MSAILMVLRSDSLLLKHRRPELYITQRLSRDEASPLEGRVFEGGKKAAGVDIPLRGLKTGIEYMLSRRRNYPTWRTRKRNTG